jgi:predicted MFS family arabinose efflux permease
MHQKDSVRLAFGGLLAMAAAMGIGRFVYTPILPVMISELHWSKVEAGLVASSNFLGYLVGALLVGRSVFVANPRPWLLTALAISTATTAGMAVSSQTHLLMTIRLIGGMASAFVIICASTLVLERLAAAGRGPLAAIHFAGVGAGIVVSAIIVAALTASGAGWQEMWIATGLTALASTLFVAAWIPAAATSQSPAPQRQDTLTRPSLAGIATAHGLFGFGYVITATFLITIVRETASIRPLEPWVWVLVGVATIPSVPVWQRLGQRVGLLKAYAVACLVEAGGVAASVEWVSPAGICVSAILLGGTFMGLTALGLMGARELSGGQPQRALGLTTASFGFGQMIGPTVAGVLSEYSGSLRAASLAATAALVLAAALAFGTSMKVARESGSPQRN